MKSKKVVINNFRNIFMPTKSIKESKEQNGNVLILSYNANEGSIVTLIGPNNVGKSNILDAISCNSADYIKNKPDWEYLWNESNHKVSLEFIDTSKIDHNVKVINTILEKNKHIIKNIAMHKEIFKLANYVHLSDLLEKENFNANSLAKYLYISTKNAESVIILLFYIQAIEVLKDIKPSVDLSNLFYFIINNFTKFLYHNHSRRESDFTHFSYGNDVVFSHNQKEYNDELTNRNNAVEKLYMSFENHFPGNKLEKIINELYWDNKNNILRLNENNIIKTNNLDFDLNSSSDFLKNLKSIIDKENKLFNSILALINSGQAQSIISGQIDQIVAKLNKEIENKISRRFNDLYFLKNEKYKFRIQRLDTYNRYSFGILLVKNDGESIVLNLDKQSEGFKWFFNFYFQILKDNSFLPGTIVLLEEPAVHLHIEGQKQWLKFIREFAKNNKIIFVMTTHSPFLIDCDHLDDIRIIYKDGEFTKINNYFSIDVDGDKESTLQILVNSFTWQNIISTLINKGDKLVLVEGLTDYIYLNYFKSKNKDYDNLHFIPINGLGKIKTMPKVIENIIMNFGPNSFILTDADKIGNDFEKWSVENKTDLKIIKISDANSKFKVIEDLFSDDNLTKYEYIKEKKTSKIIGLCKGNDDIFDKQTTDNFLKLLENIKSRI